MISKFDLMDIVPTELRSSANSLLTRLPIIPDDFKIINLKREAVYKKEKILRVLKIYRTRGGKASRARKRMIEYLRELK